MNFFGKVFAELKQVKIPFSSNIGHDFQIAFQEIDKLFQQKYLRVFNNGDQINIKPINKSKKENQKSDIKSKEEIQKGYKYFKREASLELEDLWETLFDDKIEESDVSLLNSENHGIYIGKIPLLEKGKGTYALELLETIFDEMISQQINNEVVDMNIYCGMTIASIFNGIRSLIGYANFEETEYMFKKIYLKVLKRKKGKDHKKFIDKLHVINLETSTDHMELFGFLKQVQGKNNAISIEDLKFIILNDEFRLSENPTSIEIFKYLFKKSENGHVLKEKLMSTIPEGLSQEDLSTNQNYIYYSLCSISIRLADILKGKNIHIGPSRQKIYDDIINYILGNIDNYQPSGLEELTDIINEKKQNNLYTICVDARKNIFYLKNQKRKAINRLIGTALTGLFVAGFIGETSYQIGISYQAEKSRKIESREYKNLYPKLSQIDLTKALKKIWNKGNDKEVQKRLKEMGFYEFVVIDAFEIPREKNYQYYLKVKKEMLNMLQTQFQFSPSEMGLIRILLEKHLQDNLSNLGNLIGSKYFELQSIFQLLSTNGYKNSIENAGIEIKDPIVSNPLYKYLDKLVDTLMLQENINIPNTQNSDMLNIGVMKSIYGDIKLYYKDGLFYGVRADLFISKSINEEPSTNVAKRAIMEFLFMIMNQDVALIPKDVMSIIVEQYFNKESFYEFIQKNWSCIKDPLCGIWQSDKYRVVNSFTGKEYWVSTKEIFDENDRLYRKIMVASTTENGKISIDATQKATEWILRYYNLPAFVNTMEYKDLPEDVQGYLYWRKLNKLFGK